MGHRFRELYWHSSETGSGFIPFRVLVPVSLHSAEPGGKITLMPSLVLIKSPGAATANQTFPLAGPLTVLGREDNCDIVVPNHAVSRKHAQISLRNGSQYFVEDLKSRNGTMVNNEPVLQPRMLKHDDRLKICDFLYRFHDENAPSPIPAGFGGSSLFAPLEERTEDSQSTIEAAVATRTAERLLDAQPSEKLRALLDISTALSKASDLATIIETIADVTLNVFKQSDRCFVILKEDDNLVPKVVKARRSAGSQDDQRFSRTIVRRALETGESYLSEDASSDANLGAAMSVAEFRIRSVMCVPLLTSAGVAIGAVQIDTQDRTKKFRTADLELLAIVANLASVAVDKAHLQETAAAQEKQQNEIDLARKIQRDMLPQGEPPLPGYGFYHHYSAALTVGGDYYDFIQLADGRVAVLLGDVAGKGVPASLLMVKLTAEARFCLRTESDVAAAIRMLNDQLVMGGIGDRFVTLAAIVIDPNKHTATIVNAGHINPIIFRNGEFIEIISSEESGIPLGIMSGYEYTSVERSFEPGDNVMVFSDGVTDAMDPRGEMFNLDGVYKSLAGDCTRFSHPKLVGECVVKAVQKHAAGRAQNDDIAFVCFGRLTTPPGKESQ